MSPKRKGLFLLGHHQLGQLIANGVDYGVMIACVSGFGLKATTGTAIGAFTGAVTSFTLGRVWVFEAQEGRVHGQALRYAIVSLLSLCFYTLGEGWLVGAGVQYIVARLILGVIVGIGWNFPMHRYFVFKVAQ